MPSRLSALWGREKAKLTHGIRRSFLAAIGEIVVYTGALEAGIDMAIAAILAVSGGAVAAMTIGIGTQSRLDMLQGLAETSVKSKRRRETLLGLIADIRGVQTERNFVVHAHWLIGDTGSIEGHVGRRNRAGWRHEAWSLEQFKKLADHLSEVNGELLRWSFGSGKFQRMHLEWHERYFLSPHPTLRARARKRKRRARSSST